MKIDRVYFYSSASRWLVLGADALATQFQILQISRDAYCDVVDDDRVYSKKEVDGIVSMAVGANVIPLGSSFGIIGMVSFFNGFYLYHVKSRLKVADLNGKIIYKVVKTDCLYLPSSTAKMETKLEEKYLKCFNSVDLSTDFYYSSELNLTQVWPKCVANPDDLENRFSWNHHLCRKLPSRWVLTLIHGFVGSRRLSSLRNSPELVLIARRSAEFAGTRFNRRGTDLQGNVANEVETEQIVYRPGLSHEVTSFVHHRGSVPIFWSQDMGSVPQKPPIELDHSDPWYYASVQHFTKLYQRYGGPVVALNLVKHDAGGETLLGECYRQVVGHLNQFLPEHLQIVWEWVDIARLRKDGCFGRKFQSLCEDLAHQVGISSNSKLQKGIVRVNCVDCLDRTNLTQVSIGLCALELQLGELGTPLDVSTDPCGQIFQKLFEDHGDIIGYQYGGSQLVHTLKSYRGEDPLASRSKDILATISRYYSNTFSDNEKQVALDVFLDKVHPADRHLNTIQWPRDIYQYLQTPPRAHTVIFKEDAVQDLPQVPLTSGITFETIYRPDTFKQFGDIFSYQLGKQFRQMNYHRTNIDPLAVDENLNPLLDSQYEMITHSDTGSLDEDSISSSSTENSIEDGTIHHIPLISDFTKWGRLPFGKLGKYESYDNDNTEMHIAVNDNRLFWEPHMESKHITW